MSRQASGLKAWVIQRVTGAYLALFILYLAVHFLFNAPADFAAWQGWVTAPSVTIAGMLFFLSVLMHSWIGVRDIVIDYIHCSALRVALLVVVALVLLASGIWVVKILL